MRAKKEAVAVLTALCDEEIERTVALWNRVLTSDKLTEARLRAQLLEDENYDPQLFLLAREGEKIIGFAAGIRRRVAYYERGLQPDTGWLLAFGVAPEAQRHGVGSALLAELGQRFAAAGVRRLVVGMYSPGYFMPGVDCAHYPAARPFLAAHGCRFGAQHTAMCRTLFDYAIPENVQKKRAAAEAAGYRFARYADGQAETLCSFVQANFTAGWLNNAKELIRRGAAAQQTWLCFAPDGSLAGYVQRGMGDHPSRFGPFGVRADLRDAGLGSVLLALMLEDMSERGLYLVYFMTTDAAGARIYARYGFAPYRSFLEAELPLGPAQGKNS